MRNGPAGPRRPYPDPVGQDDLIASLERALAATPEDVALRIHVAELLMTADRRSEVVPHAAYLLQLDPQSPDGRTLMFQALSGGSPAAPAAPPVEPADVTTSFDWSRAEGDLGELVPPMFADSSAEQSEVGAFDVEAVGMTLADVGGMTEVKQRLNAALLAPMRNEELRTMYRKSLRGGLLLYGPPGCGKTYIARALAGELGPSSSRCRSPTCWTCTSGRASATCTSCSRLPERTHPVCCSWTRWTPSATSAAG